MEILTIKNQKLTDTKLYNIILKHLKDYGVSCIEIIDCELILNKTMIIDRVLADKPKYIPSFIWNKLNIGLDTINNIPIKSMACIGCIITLKDK